jgi:Carbohydrate binding domain/PEP-CTERM motif
MNQKTLLFIIAVLASVALSAHANLVVNPGFETGSFAPWTNTGDTSFSGVSSSVPVHSGSFAAYFGPTSSNGFLDQNIATIAGQSYIVDFWLSNDDSTGNNSMSASFNGVQILSLTNSAPFPYTHYTSNPIMATGSTTDLNFTFYNPPAYYYLDDVSVNAVPEPGTLGLIALGGLGLVGAVRKRRSV